MGLTRRFATVEAAYRARGDLGPPPPPPTREQRLERIGRWLRDVGSSALWGMHTPQLWPALRAWRDARASSPEARAKAYLALQERLLRAVAEHRLRSKGQVGRCNACPAINSHYGGRLQEVRPLPECPACGVCHTDDPEALRLAAARMRACWANRPGAVADGEADWAEVAMLVVDGPPAELRGWFAATPRRRPAQLPTTCAKRGGRIRTTTWCSPPRRGPGSGPCCGHGSASTAGQSRDGRGDSGDHHPSRLSSEYRGRGA